MFFDYPRLSMGLERACTRILKVSKADEERKSREAVKIHERPVYVERLATTNNESSSVAGGMQKVGRFHVLAQRLDMQSVSRVSILVFDQLVLSVSIGMLSSGEKSDGLLCPAMSSQPACVAREERETIESDQRRP